jgi:DNA-binding response OmpR family regulator
VDDDPDLRILVHKALSQDGYIVSEASSGQEALALIDAQAPDLLVLDLFMPNQGGLEVLKVLRSRSATAALPVLVLTALDDEVNTRAGFELGATDYLTKPFSIPQLAARLSRAPRMKNVLIPPEPPRRVLNRGGLPVRFGSGQAGAKTPSEG